MTIQRLDIEEKKLFPIALTPIEKEMLSFLSTDTGLSMSGVLRHLLVRECASRQLTMMHKPDLRRTEKDG